MRRAQKQAVLECLQSLQEAHKEIKRALRRHENIMAQNMLCECQEFAVSIGENIERTEGEGHITVSCMEEYCELLFYISEEVRKGNTDEEKIYQLLREQLIKMDNSARNDICVKMEIVFLPYKAAMWDSLESIWDAAENDPLCDAYVVPIPYFDKNQDGSLGEMHYEGYEYPDYVPVTDWRTYNLDKRRPDVVYIHNPYDQYNYVTSVHPDFYASKLKKNTDMLVYCPYFVGVNNHVDEHFCITPGVLYADRVIVESEEVRKIYLDVLYKYEDENNCRGQFGNLEKKITVSQNGSPKLLKIKNTKRENICIPENWEALIKGNGVERKKIILYNTTVDTALKASYSFINKIRSVLKVFKYRKDTVLLWRPHPLLFATLRSMRPEMYTALLKIVEDYKKEGWGIYDDTPDIDRAIVISDAYYGDWSSVVTMYQTTGKPIMIQNCEILD